MAQHDEAHNHHQGLDKENVVCQVFAPELSMSRSGEKRRVKFA